MSFEAFELFKFGLPSSLTYEFGTLDLLPMRFLCFCKSQFIMYSYMILFVSDQIASLFTAKRGVLVKF